MNRQKHLEFIQAVILFYLTLMASSLLVVPAGNGDGSTVPGASGQ